MTGRTAPAISACMPTGMAPARIRAGLDAIREHDHLPVVRVAPGRTSLRTPEGTLSIETKGAILTATWRTGRTTRGIMKMPWRLASDLPDARMGVRETDLTVRRLLASMRSAMERHLSDASMELGSDARILDLTRIAASASVIAHGGWRPRLFVQHASEWSRSTLEGDLGELVNEGAEETMEAIVASAGASMRPPNAHRVVAASKNTTRNLSFNLALHGFVEIVRPMGVVEAMRLMGKAGVAVR